MVILETRKRERLHTQKEITQRLQQWALGDEAALDAVINDIYSVLKQFTQRRLKHQSMLETLNPSAVLSEVHRFFQDPNGPDTRTQFYSLAAPMMRRILTDLLRHQQIGMRGVTVDIAGGVNDDLEDAQSTPPVVFLALNRALGKLVQLDPRQCWLVELRCFGGMTLTELAEVSGLSQDSVKREWQYAREWLIQQLQPGRRLSA